MLSSSDYLVNGLHTLRRENGLYGCPILKFSVRHQDKLHRRVDFVEYTDEGN